MNKILIGIENKGNYCYINSILQFLFNVEPLNNTILEYLARGKCYYSLPLSEKSPESKFKDKPFSVTSSHSEFGNKQPRKIVVSNHDILKTFQNEFLIAYRNILLEISDKEYISKNVANGYITLVKDKDNGDKIYIDEESVIESCELISKLDKLVYLGDFQHDAHEILIYILNIVHSGMKESKPFTEISSSLDKIKNIASAKWDEYNNSFSIINKTFKGQMQNRIICQTCYTENNVFNSFLDINLYPSSDVNNVQDSLNSTCETIIVNDYFCESCKKCSKAEKDIIFCRLPEYLIIHLNILDYDKNSYFNEKLIIDKIINLHEYNKPKLYDLVSSINHLGESFEDGHYVNTLYSSDGVYTFDDEDIHRFTYGIPYILLYRQCKI